MLQQINLYQNVLRTDDRTFRHRPLLLTFFGGLFLLFLATGLLFWQSYSLRHQLRTLQSEQTTLVTRLSELTKQYPPKVKSQLLEKEIANLVIARDARGPLLHLLESENQKNNTEGFSAIIESLALQNPAGVWLRRVKIYAGGRQLRLEGSTHNPNLAPRYLQQLGQSPTLAGIEFDRFQLDRSTDDPGTINFTLQTTVEGNQ